MQNFTNYRFIFYKIYDPSEAKMTGKLQSSKENCVYYCYKVGLYCISCATQLLVFICTQEHGVYLSVNLYVQPKHSIIEYKLMQYNKNVSSIHVALLLRSWLVS